MKFFIISFLFLNFSYASVKTQIHIDETGYQVGIRMQFSSFVKLNTVIQTLKSPYIVSQLSSSIKSINNKPVGSQTYASLMVVKSYGMTSELLSNCEEVKSQNQWTRACVLNTNEKDGGQFMLKKKDTVVCKQTETDPVICEFDIQGQAKPIQLFGINLMSAEKFSAKAKKEALINFFKIYYFIETHGLSIRQGLKAYEASSVPTQLDQFSYKGIIEI